MGGGGMGAANLRCSIRVLLDAVAARKIYGYQDIFNYCEY
jgi:hypothetical protein